MHLVVVKAFVYYLSKLTDLHKQIPLKGFHQDIPAKIQAIQGYISNMSVFKIM